MMKKYQKTITVYELDGGFFVEVCKEDDVVEFFLCHKNYGVKSHMFGLFNCDSETEEQILEANAEDYMNIYKAEYFDDIDLEVE